MKISIMTMTTPFATSVFTLRILALAAGFLFVCSIFSYAGVHAVITDNVMDQLETALQGNKELPETARACDVELFGTSCKIDSYMSLL